MANLNETDEWAAGIYQLEEDDPVLGGPTGIDNMAPRQLASRDRYQRLRNVTPWDASLTYPANVAYVSYGGTTWKSVGESLNVAPGTDAAKWVRWGFTLAELNASLGDAVAAHEAKPDPHPQYATDAALAEHAADLNAHAQYVRHDGAQGLSAPQAAQARANIGAEAVGIAASEVQRNAARYGVDTGVANAAAVTYAPAITALTDGMVLLFAAAAANGPGAMTFNVNGLGAKPVVGAAQAALQGGEIFANGKCMVVWSAALNSFVLIECTGAARQVGPATKSQHALQLGQATGRLLRRLIFIRIAGVPNVSINGAPFTTVGAGAHVPIANNMAYSIYKVQAGGAAGGGPTLPSAGNVSLGSPGSGGGYVEGLFTAAQIGASQPVTVGLGGVKVVGGTGGNGGASSIGSLITAAGGIGGGTLNNQVPPTAAGNGNVAASTGGNILQINGLGGYPALATSAAAGGNVGGIGGSSAFGPGATGGTNAAGTDAQNYGTGGSGAVINNGFGGNTAGGNGFAGIAMIEEYA